jgi:hypothetical protein
MALLTVYSFVDQLTPLKTLKVTGDAYGNVLINAHILSTADATTLASNLSALVTAIGNGDRGATTPLAP